MLPGIEPGPAWISRMHGKHHTQSCLLKNLKIKIMVLPIIVIILYIASPEIISLEIENLMKP